MDGHQYTARFEAPGGIPIKKVYLDTLGILTVGLGHTGPDVHEGDEWTSDRCWAAFYNDYAIAAGHAPNILGVSVFSQLSDPRKAVAIDLCFNPGPTKLKGFHLMLDAIRKHDWEGAKRELLDSLYARQVKTRAATNASVLLTGLWPQDQVTA